MHASVMAFVRRYAKDMIAYRREHLNPVREGWKMLPEGARTLVKWIRLKLRNFNAKHTATGP